MPLQPMIVLPFNDIGFVPVRVPCREVVDARLELRYRGRVVAESREWGLAGPSDSPTLVFKVLLQSPLVPLQRPRLEYLGFLGAAAPGRPAGLTVDPRNPYLWRGWSLERPRYSEHSFPTTFRPDRLNGLIFSAPVTGEMCYRLQTGREVQHICIDFDVPMRVFLVGVWGWVEGVSFTLKHGGMGPLYVWLARWETGWELATLRAEIATPEGSYLATENVRLVALSEDWYDVVVGGPDYVELVGEEVVPL